MGECEHKWVYMETVRRHAKTASPGYSAQIDWKRVDRFYCEKCLEVKELTKTAPGYYEKPEWFD
ncbi:MAG: hypothetical protein WC373_05605 [Smithella sp.]